MCMGEALRTIAFKVRTASCGGTACVNSFGDEQLAVDMLADKLLFEVQNYTLAEPGFYFSYKKNEYVLKDITFKAKKGETTALVGHTGSGKSSIINLLFRFYDPDKGAVYLDDYATTTLSRESLRKKMGIVLQDPYLFKGTIASNITLNDPVISREKVKEAIKAIGGEVLLRDMPLGIDEPVTDKGSTLSSGQKQLVSFARALAFNPEVLILDEATSNIDTETEQLIQNAMNVVKEGRTTFIIAHRLSTIQYADQILVLSKGQIVERGSHHTLLKLNGEYAKMYLTQSADTTSESSKIPKKD